MSQWQLQSLESGGHRTCKAVHSRQWLTETYWILKLKTALIYSELNEKIDFRPFFNKCLFSYCSEQWCVWCLVYCLTSNVVCNMDSLLYILSVPLYNNSILLYKESRQFTLFFSRHTLKLQPVGISTFCDIWILHTLNIKEFLITAMCLKNLK